ncbi:MAG TPA: protein kinase [Longimicrobiales bacterium]|nr:protein kinase [Longimicrobiales bacterium]
MKLSEGARLGPYQIVGAIGAGGMGEVYKATDTRLSRTVAIKVLPTHFAADPEMEQRFHREAQTIAGLNHPNICILHDIGEQDGTHFLVMEYVEGETLADRISRGPLPLGEALRIAGEIVDALDKAHQQGIVHRDLKPANIMLAKATRTGTAAASKIITAPVESPVKTTSDPAPPSLGSSPKSGRPSSSASSMSMRSSSSHIKLLDFGLAKWVAPGGGNTIAAQSTRMDVTSQGAIIGTLQYMAPEQVEGKEADSRTDIFALGAVLYEMLTGKRAFEGKSQASLIGAIMKAEPRPISHHAPETPAVLEHMIARCLVKDPEERWQDAHSIKLKLQWIARHRDSAAVAAAPRTWRDTAMWATLAILLAGVSVPAYLHWRGGLQPGAIQFRHTISGLSEADIAVSPDGKTIAFVAKPDNAGAASLYIRPIGGLAAVKLAGTDNASQPFWSPDSQFIAYVSGGKLKKVSASGGATQDLCDATDFYGGAWSRGGTIVFGTPKGLFKVSAEGGEQTPASELGEAEAGHFWPSFLPDGRHIVYLAWSEERARRAIYAGSLDSKDRTRLVDAESNPVYAATPASGGQLLFHQQSTLFAQPFDPKGLRFTGDPAQIIGGMSLAANGFGKFSASQNGALIYFQGRPGASTSGRGRVTLAQFGWVGRSGGRAGAAIDPGQYGDMDLSPDGKFIAVTRQEAGAAAADIWVFDWAKQVSQKITNDPVDAVDPVWSPDGRRVAFTSYRKGNADIYVTNANGVGAETPLLESALNESVEDWSRDGRFIAFEFGKDAFQDIYALPIENDTPGKPFPVVEGRYQKDEPQFSKDGKWLAYTADQNEPGRFQVYVVSFPVPDRKLQVSTEGGGQPRWGWDGKRIYYRTPDHRMAFVDVTLGETIQAGRPHFIGAAPTRHPTAADPTRHMFSVGADGQFLVRIPVGAATVGATGGEGPLVPITITAGGGGSSSIAQRGPVTSGLTVILHWTSLLKKGGT